MILTNRELIICQHYVIILNSVFGEWQELEKNGKL